MALESITNGSIGTRSARDWMASDAGLALLRGAIKKAFLGLTLSRQRGLHVGAGLADGVQDVIVHLLAKDATLPATEKDMISAVQGVVRQYLTTKHVRIESPESYRIHRRIVGILKDGRTFRFSQGRYALQEESMDGLSEQANDLEVLMLKVANEIPRPLRNNLKSGRGGSSLVISTAELQGLIVAVMRCAHAPLTLQWISQLVLSRVPTMDPVWRELPEHDEGIGLRVRLSRSELHEALAQRDADAAAHQLIGRIYPKGKNPAKQIRTILAHLDYEGTAAPTNLEIAARVGISDSSVSDYLRVFLEGLRQGIDRLGIDPKPAFIKKYLYPALIKELRQRLETGVTSSPTVPLPRPPSARP